MVEIAKAAVRDRLDMTEMSPPSLEKHAAHQNLQHSSQERRRRRQSQSTPDKRRKLDPSHKDPEHVFATPSGTPPASRGRFRLPTEVLPDFTPPRAERPASPRTDKDKIVDECVARMLRNVHFAKIADLDDLDHAISYTLPGLMQRLHTGTSRTSQESAREPARPLPERTLAAPIRLIVIDSLPALFRSTFSNSMSSIVQRSIALCDIADRLKKLSVLGIPDGVVAFSSDDSHGGAAVIVINQVTDAFNKEKRFARAAVLERAIGPAARRRTAHAYSIDQLPQHLRIASQAGSEAPLSYAEQAAHITGLYASVPTTATFTTNGLADLRDFADNVSPKVAQLGQVWTNCITTRLMLCRTQRRVPSSVAFLPRGGAIASQMSATASQSGTTPSDSQVRRAVLVFSPFAPAGVGADSARDFLIAPEGVRVLDCDPLHTGSLPAKSALVPRGNNEGETNEEDEWAQFDLGEDELALLVDVDMEDGRATDLGHLPSDEPTSSATDAPAAAPPTSSASVTNRATSPPPFECDAPDALGVPDDIGDENAHVGDVIPDADAEAGAGANGSVEAQAERETDRAPHAAQNYMTSIYLARSSQASEAPSRQSGTRNISTISTTSKRPF